MPTYSIDIKTPIKCLQQKYVYPAEDKWQVINKAVRTFLQKTKTLYYGGWSIHLFLKSIDESHAIYNDDDICDMSDIDAFSVIPVEDMIQLTKILKQATNELSYVITDGVHANQFVLQINFMGSGKLMDYLYMSPKIYNFLPKSSYSGGLCLDPKIELLKQYNMLSNTFFLATDKDLSKASKRIALLEKYALVPWLKDNNFWDTRKRFSIIDSKPHNQTQTSLKAFIHNDWFQRQPLMSTVGSTSFNRYHRKVKPLFEHQIKNIEYVAHDAIFIKLINSLVKELKDYCKTHAIDDNLISIKVHDSFIGNIGPLYNGWIDIHYHELSLCKIYSLATPVQMYDADKKICSYFFNMAHMMWRVLYAQFRNNKDEEQFFWSLVTRSYKGFVKHPNSTYYKVYIDKEHSLGTFPIRNYTMVKNLQKRQGHMFKYMTPQGEKDTQKVDWPTVNSMYRKFEGDIIFSKSLAHVSKVPQPEFLYKRY